MVDLTIGVRVPINTRDEAIELLLLHQLEVASIFNARWYLDEWANGRDPPCCAACGSIAYVPDPKSIGGSTIPVAPLVLRFGVASCGAAVAMAVGHERAAAMRDGATLEDAAAMFGPELEKRGDRYWHAVMVTPRGREDVTEKMPR